MKNLADFARNARYVVEKDFTLKAQKRKFLFITLNLMFRNSQSASCNSVKPKIREAPQH